MHFIVALALAASEATSRLQTGHRRLQVAARRNSVVPRADLCQLVADSGRRHLRSADANALTVPRTNTGLGDRSFSVAGPKVWDSLPVTLRQPDVEFGQFKTTFKDISVWRGCSALVTFLDFNAVCTN